MSEAAVSHSSAPRWIERTLVAAIIAVAVTLSMIWVFRVPMFQEPDEDQHYDYAFSIYSAGRLITAREGTARFASQPLVRRMMKQAGFGAMRYNAAGRVPAGYGSTSFFQNLDAAVTRARVSTTDGKHVPNLIRVYPYLYYALDALAIAVGSKLTHGSPTGEFFFARSFSVLLLSISLVFIYLILREFPLKLGQRLCILAVIGWFPLTTWVSAYVQPDNLALTIVSASLFLGYHLRGRLENPWRFAWLGIAIGALWLTKIQYFVAVAPAVIAPLVLLAARPRRSTLYWATALLCMGLPFAVAYFSNRWVTSGEEVGSATFINAFGGDAWDSAPAGAWSRTAFILNEIAHAYTRIFVWGQGFLTYYGFFGWLPTPIFRAPQAFQVRAIYFPLSVFSEAVSALMLLRMLRAWRSLKSLATRRSRPAALRLLASDCVLNSYLTFTILIIAIWVVTSGTLGQYGRYWLPFQLATVLCAVFYAPQVLPRRLGSALTTTTMVGLLAYSTAAAIAGPGTLQARFYLPPRYELSDTENMAFVDSIDDRSIRPNGATPEISPKGNTLRVGGWAVDSRAGEPARKVDLVIDHTMLVPTQYGIPHCDRLLEIPVWDDELLRCGFVASVDLRTIRPGDHVLSLLVYEHDRLQPHRSGNELTIHIGPGGSQNVLAK